MSHPQADELLEGLQRLFALPDDLLQRPQREIRDSAERSLTIYAPLAKVRFSFEGNLDYHSQNDRLERVVSLHFVWPGTGEREVTLAQKLGFARPEHRTVKRLHVDFNQPYVRQGPRRTRVFDTVQEPPYAAEPVADPRQGLDFGLSVLREVFGVPDSHWLWITDLDANQDMWPTTLQRPARWPEGVAFYPDF